MTLTASEKTDEKIQKTKKQRKMECISFTNKPQAQ